MEQILRAKKSEPVLKIKSPSVGPPDQFRFSPIPMYTDAFVALLILFSVRSQRFQRPASPWKTKFVSLAFSTCLHLWRLFKFTCRLITSRGTIERLCQSVEDEGALRIDGRTIGVQDLETRRVLWRIGWNHLALLITSLNY